MATSLTFTSAGFLQATNATASIATNTKFDILAADASYTRRIYGVSVTQTLASAQTMKFHLVNGANVYQIFTLNVPASAGNSTTVASVDIFGNVYGAALFNKQRDSNGVPYFNLPANWKMQTEFNTALTGATMSVFVFGETYA